MEAQNQNLETFLRRLVIAPRARQSAAVESALKLLSGDPPAEQLLYSAAQACRTLAISRPTLWRLCKSGALQAVQIRGAKRYRRADLLALTEGRKEGEHGPR